MLYYGDKVKVKRGFFQGQAGSAVDVDANGGYWISLDNNGPTKCFQLHELTVASADSESEESK